MDEDFIRERAEDGDYSEEATEDLLAMHEFIHKITNFLQDLIDDNTLADEQAETAEAFISDYDDGILD